LAVSINTGTWLCARMRRSASIPPTRGIITSSTTIAYSPDSAPATPASPSWTTSASKPSCSMYSRSIDANSTSSSTNKTLLIAHLFSAEICPR